MLRGARNTERGEKRPCRSIEISNWHGQQPTRFKFAATGEGCAFLAAITQDDLAALRRRLTPRSPEIAWLSTYAKAASRIASDCAG